MNIKDARSLTLDYFSRAGIIIKPEEAANIEVADFGLGDFETSGLEIVTYVNTERCCAKELVLFPHQTCPEHLHPAVSGQPGKEETFRCRWGEVYLYVEGEETPDRAQEPPEGVYTVFREVRLYPGDQFTIYPGTKHWFKAGANGAVVSEFSTKSIDEADIFTDPRVIR